MNQTQNKIVINKIIIKCEKTRKSRTPQNDPKTGPQAHLPKKSTFFIFFTFFMIFLFHLRNEYYLFY